ncbi:MAG: rhomboid family intramembrane serine protease [Solobacterium sp.]|nr:rhomboid family intramembrane serine protease [Solobacterium sp.]
MIITWITIAVCVVCSIVMNRSPYPLDQAVKFGALLPLRVKRGEYWRLITAGFLHLQVGHLLMNMYSLYNLGDLEYVFGSLRYAVILLVSVIGGNVLATWLSRDDRTVSLGISGGLYGLLAAYMVLLFKLGLLNSPSIRGSLIRTLIVNLLINLMPNVSRQAHAGGFIAGFVLAMLMI